MTRGRSQWIWFALVAVALVVPGAACKTVPPAQETPTPAAPAFDSSAKPAEKIDDSAGFKEAEPSSDSFGDSALGTADRLNAQGILKPVYFDFDRADLRQDAQQTLTANAARIRDNATLAVRIEGHCDERGTVEYNLALGDRRARAAREQLVSLGIPASRLRTISYGKERPADPGHNESAWALNRRAEFIFIAE